MEKQNLLVEQRKEIGKSATRKIRRAGKLPGVLYGLGKCEPVTVDPRTIHRILLNEKERNQVWTVEGTGVAGKSVLVKDYQIDPLSRALVHVDLLEIDITKKIGVTVNLNFIGKAK